MRRIRNLHVQAATVANGETSLRKVMAEVPDGGLVGLHRAIVGIDPAGEVMLARESGRYTVTHAGSGFAVVHMRHTNREAARHVARALTIIFERCESPRSEQEVRRNKPLNRAVRSFLQDALRHEGSLVRTPAPTDWAHYRDLAARALRDVGLLDADGEELE